jgi:hypothetical protein
MLRRPKRSNNEVLASTEKEEEKEAEELYVRQYQGQGFASSLIMFQLNLRLSRFTNDSRYLISCLYVLTVYFSIVTTAEGRHPAQTIRIYCHRKKFVAC